MILKNLFFNPILHGEGKFYPAKTFLLIFKNYSRSSACRDFIENQI